MATGLLLTGLEHTAQAGLNTQIAMAEWEDRRAGRIE